MNLHCTEPGVTLTSNGAPVVSLARSALEGHGSFYRSIGAINSPLFALFPGRELRDDGFKRDRACSNTGNGRRYVSCSTVLRTGKDDLDRVKSFAEYLGNTSITLWGPPRPVRALPPPPRLLERSVLPPCVRAGGGHGRHAVLAQARSWVQQGRSLGRDGHCVRGRRAAALAPRAGAAS